MDLCPDEEMIDRFIAHQFEGREAQQIAAHLERCDECLLLIGARSQQRTASTRGSIDDGSGPSMLADDWSPPEEIDEFYLRRELGSGAMGRVYLAHDRKLDRDVALKVLAVKTPLASARERFQIEARAIARLSHPNIVAIYRVGEVVGRPYLISEYALGQSLDRMERPVPWRHVLALSIEIARGLAAAHERGVLHRDLKPANIMVLPDGGIKLLDFGLAKLNDSREDPTSDAGSSPPPPLSLSLTATGCVLGTPRYVAPEIWNGQPATVQSDLYSLGALLYEQLSGRSPHLGTDVSEIRHLATTQDAVALRVRVPEISPAFATLLDRCLRRDPTARPASAKELYRDLSALAQKRERSFGPWPTDRRIAWVLRLGLLTTGALAVGGFIARAPRPMHRLPFTPSVVSPQAPVPPQLPPGVPGDVAPFRAELGHPGDRARPPSSVNAAAVRRRVKAAAPVVPERLDVPFLYWENEEEQK